MLTLEWQPVTVPVSAAALATLVLVLGPQWHGPAPTPTTTSNRIPLLCQADPHLCLDGLVIRRPHVLIAGLPRI